MASGARSYQRCDRQDDGRKDRQQQEKRRRRPARFSGHSSTTWRAFEPLEDRTLLTVNLFLDFGDDFTGARGLTTDGATAVTHDDFQNTVRGPNLDIGGKPGSTAYTFTSFSTEAANAGFNTADTATLRADILQLVQRYYAPFDVNVQDLTGADGAQTLPDVTARLTGGAAYVFVAGLTPDAGAIDNGLNGQAGGTDKNSAAQDNPNADTAIALANHEFGNGSATTALGIAKSALAFAYTIAHEAGHTLGLRHTDNENNDDNRVLTSSDMISKFYDSAGSVAGRDQRYNFNFFTRFTLPLSVSEGWPAPATENPYNIYAANLGLKPNAPAYITGTGGSDHITVTNAGGGMASVTVQAYREDAMTNLIDTQTYSVPLANGLLIESGFGADLVEIDDTLGGTVTVHGMAGNDQLLVDGNNAASAVYTPGGSSSTSLDGSTNMAGSIVAGTTTINFSEFHAAGAVTVKNVQSLTFRSPNASDQIALDSPKAGQNRINGSSAGQAFVPLTFFDDAAIVLDLATNDGGGAPDTVNIPSALAATLLKNFTINTGGGDDILNLTFANLALPVAGGAFTYDAGAAGAAGDVLTAQADVNWKLSNSGLQSSGGGALALTSVEIAQLTGGGSMNGFDVSGWTGGGSLSGGGGTDMVMATKNANFTLNTGSLATTDGMSVSLSSIETANLMGGAGNNSFAVQSWNGPMVRLSGAAGSDTYTIGNGDLDAVSTSVSIMDNDGAADAIVVNDAGNSKVVDYTIGSFTTVFHDGTARAFQGINFPDGVIESFTLNATTGANEIHIKPNAVTTYFINGNDPTFAGPGGDFLDVDFTGTKGRKLTYSGPPLGNGSWQFLGSGSPLTGVRKPINFTSIEKLNYFEILAVGADGGASSKPLVKVYDAETKDLVTQFTAYEANWTGGVRVAVGDINGDGIPEIVTAPGGNHAPTIKIFDALTGMQKFAFQGTSGGPTSGVQVAVGDVSGDGKADIVTARDFGTPSVHVFVQGTNPASPFRTYVGVASAGVPATPTISVFSDIFGFSLGVGGLAIGNVLRHANGVGDIVVGSGAGFPQAMVRVFDYFDNGTSTRWAKQFTPFAFSLFGGGPVSVAVGNVDSASGFADVVMGSSKGEVAIWHNNTNTITHFNPNPYTGTGGDAPVRVAISYTGPATAPGHAGAQIWTAQGPTGRSHDIRKFTPSGALVDHILESDPAFNGGFWLG